MTDAGQSLAFHSLFRRTHRLLKSGTPGSEVSLEPLNKPGIEHTRSGLRQSAKWVSESKAEMDSFSLLQPAKAETISAGS